MKEVFVYLPAIMIVLEFPPRLSFNSQVKTESLYGTNVFLFDVFFDSHKLLEFSAKRKQ